MTAPYPGIAEVQKNTRDRDQFVLGKLPKQLSSSGWTLLATGGYGRQEIAPYSDLDFLILFVPGSDLSWVEGFVQSLWDTGLQIGHAVRHLEDVRRGIQKDVKTLASYLDARYLAGSKSLFQELEREVQGRVAEGDGIPFLKQKWVEREKRLARLSPSVRMQEPELKEGRGGLRDYQFLRWMVRVREGQPSSSFWISLRQFVGSATAKNMHESVDWLFKVRNQLHQKNQRQVNRLGFSDQESLATPFGYKHSGAWRASERFMTTYYSHADRLALGLENLFFETLEKAESSGTKGKSQSISTLLDVVKQVGDDRVGWLKLARELTLKVEGTWTARRRTEARHYLWQAFEDPITLSSLLRAADRSGLLSKLFPSWRRIRNRIQHNFLHAYTIDEHLLRTVEEVCEAFARKEMPFITSPRAMRILLVAAWLHDLGKGSKQDHVVYGVELAGKVLDQLGASLKDRGDVLFLIRNHLVLSHTAQRSDLSDPRVVERFAKKVRRPDRLHWLYALTCADIRATGANVYTEWKGGLLRKLVQATLQYWRQKGRLKQDLSTRRSELLSKLKQSQKSPMSTKSWSGFGAQLPLRYFAQVDLAQILHDDGLLAQKPLKTELVASVEHLDNSAEVVLTVVTKDQRGLFERFARVLAQEGWNIRSSSIFTTKAGWVLDRFVLDEPRNFERRATRLKKALSEAMAETERKTEKKGSGRGLPPRPAPYVPRQVVVREDRSRKRVIVEVYGKDRKGLLADLAACFASERMAIQQAQIITEGERVADIFFVTNERGGKAPSLKRVNRLKGRLLADGLT